MRRSRARGALESSIDWFWQTRQRNPADRPRARLSKTGSASISSGSTAIASATGRSTIMRITRSLRIGLFRRCSGQRPAPARCADAEAAIAQRQSAAEKHDRGAEPDAGRERVEIDAHHPAAFGCRIAHDDIEIARGERANAGFGRRLVARLKYPLLGDEGGDHAPAR